MTATNPDSATVRQLSAPEALERLSELSDILLDCVNGGASVSFMAPLSRDKADSFWKNVASGVAGGDRVLLVAEDATSGEMVGTVQVLLRFPENQPHRGEVAKMLVRQAWRRRGLGGRLMRAAEFAAFANGKTVLVLDTASDDAERLYERLGWVRVGVVPNFALMPDGRPCATTFYYKSLDGG